MLHSDNKSILSLMEDRKRRKKRKRRETPNWELEWIYEKRSRHLPELYKVHERRLSSHAVSHSTSLPQSLTPSINPIYFILLRRLLQVDAVPCCSSPGEIIKAKSIHNTLVVQLRVSRIIKFLYLLFFTGTYAVALFLL